MPRVASGRKPRTTKPRQGNLSIPNSICHLRLAELPATRRLHLVLKASGVQKLGDLRGRNLSELLTQRHCGVRTVLALQQLIQLAISGEFDQSRIQQSNAAEALLNLIETAIARLPDSDRSLILKRIGVGGQPPLTLKHLGYERGLTRERIRKILEKRLDVIRKTFGPRIPRLLERVKKRCISNICPLTPALLEQWAPQFQSRLRLSAKAHVRIIGALDNSIPSWPDGHTISSNVDRDVRELGVHLATVVRNACGRIRVPEAYRRLRTRRGYRWLTVEEFLRLLRKAGRIRMEFDEPQRPLIRAFRRRILRRRASS
jgi:hypothetical protein